MEKGNIYGHIEDYASHPENYDPSHLEYIYLEYIKGMTETRKGSLTCQQAKELIGGDPVAVTECYVPDLYEKTGAQLFCIISHETGKPWLNTYIIKGNTVFKLSSQYYDFIVYDIDNDGNDEMLFLEHGWTSGVTSCYISALGFDNGSIKVKFREFFHSIYSEMRLKKGSDGEIYFCTYSYEKGIIARSSFQKIGFSNGKIILENYP